MKGAIPQIRCIVRLANSALLRQQAVSVSGYEYIDTMNFGGGVLDSFSDSRILELQWEEVYGKLRELRQRQTTRSPDLTCTLQLLSLSETVRAMSAQIRERSSLIRSKAG